MLVLTLHLEVLYTVFCGRDECIGGPGQIPVDRGTIDQTWEGSYQFSKLIAYWTHANDQT
jgi:hypothetical protein